MSDDVKGVIKIGSPIERLGNAGHLTSRQNIDAKCGVV